MMSVNKTTDENSIIHADRDHAATERGAQWRGAVCGAALRRSVFFSIPLLLSQVYVQQQHREQQFQQLLATVCIIISSIFLAGSPLLPLCWLSCFFLLFCLSRRAAKRAAAQLLL